MTSVPSWTTLTPISCTRLPGRSNVVRSSRGCSGTGRRISALKRISWRSGSGSNRSIARPTMAAMGPAGDLGACLAKYLREHQPHLLGVYDVDFLRGLIEQRLANPSADMRLGMEAHRSF